MQKFYLLSILIMSVALPIRSVSRATIHEAARTLRWQFLVYLWLWAMGVRYIYWKLPP